MSRVHANLEYRDFTMPASVEQKTVCELTGYLARAGSCPAVTEYFASGTVPDEVCPGHGEEEEEEEEEENTNQNPDGNTTDPNPGGDNEGNETPNPDPANPDPEPNPTPEDPTAWLPYWRGFCRINS